MDDSRRVSLPAATYHGAHPQHASSLAACRPPNQGGAVFDSRLWRHSRSEPAVTSFPTSPTLIAFFRCVNPDAEAQHHGQTRGIAGACYQKSGRAAAKLPRLRRSSEPVLYLGTSSCRQWLDRQDSRASSRIRAEGTDADEGPLREQAWPRASAITSVGKLPGAISSPLPTTTAMSPRITSIAFVKPSPILKSDLPEDALTCLIRPTLRSR